MQLKDLFARYRFPENKLAQLEITFIHRGVPEDKKTIAGSSIVKIGHGFFEYFDGVENVHIPFHRILEIRDKGILTYTKAKH